MKKKYARLLSVIIVLFCLMNLLGIGYHSSGSARKDLEENLRLLHGDTYIGREVKNGIEDMEFSIESDSFFFTDWNLRNFFGWDYQYKCKVTYTVYSGGEIVNIRTITYKGLDPMGHDEADRRAYIDVESAEEQISKP